MPTILDVPHKQYLISKSGPEYLLKDAGPEYIFTDPGMPKIIAEDEDTTLYHDHMGSIIIPLQSIILHYTAAENISKHRVVVLNSEEKLVYADPTNSNHRMRILGISTENIAIGASGGVMIQGEMNNDSWMFDPTHIVYLGGQGTLIQIPPISGFTVPVAVATSSEALVVRIALQTYIKSLYITLGTLDITNEYCDLPDQPISPIEDHIQLSVVHGTTQKYGEDYIMTTGNLGENRLLWNLTTYGKTSNMHNLLDEGDILYVTYVY